MFLGFKLGLMTKLTLPISELEKPSMVQSGEVLISGLDTGPTEEQRDNLTPTEDRLRFQPTRPSIEPTDEDG